MNRIVKRITAAAVGLTAIGCLMAALPTSVTSAAPHSGIAFAAGLSIGDSAPAITVKEFVKGTPVTELPKGQVSVVEFWATWCGPCRMSIPHLTEMAKQYPQVTFVGVSVWEQDQAKVAPFVQQMGDKMDYHVAMDSVAPGADGNSGVMAKTWMMAAGQNGIPTAFIVGKDGKIAWIGHPMTMAEPLAKITAGKWDVAAAASEFKEKQAAEEAMMAMQMDLQKAAKSGDFKQVVAIYDKAIAANPKLEAGQLGMAKFAALRRVGDDAATIAYGKHLVTDVYKNDVESLNAFAWPLVDPAAKIKSSPAFAALALEGAKKADTLSEGKNGEIADTLAAAYYATGDIRGAVDTETRALKLITVSNPAEVAQMKTQLDKYSEVASTNK